jgi:hypothetical protein
MLRAVIKETSERLRHSQLSSSLFQHHTATDQIMRALRPNTQSLATSGGGTLAGRHTAARTASTWPHHFTQPPSQGPLHSPLTPILRLGSRHHAPFAARSIAIPPSWSKSHREEEDSAAAAAAAAAAEKQQETVAEPSPSYRSTPLEKQARELHAVNTAVVVNGLILVSKLAVFTLTSSGALLAEALHSGADMVNQLLLRAGVRQSRRAPNRQHPYGYGREKYVYALMSAVGVFCLGAGASVVHGIQCLFDPPSLEHMAYSMWGACNAIAIIAAIDLIMRG